MGAWAPPAFRLRLKVAGEMSRAIGHDSFPVAIATAL